MSDTLSDLFARDPLQLTDRDLDQIIAYYRQARQNFIADPKPAAAASRAKKASHIPLESLLDE